jgi:hypothetical protein
MGARKALPPVAPPLEDAICAAIDAEKKRGPTNLFFAPIYAFTAAVAHMARGQERQDIMDGRPKRPSGRSKEWNEGFDAAMSEFMKLLVERSMLN